MTMTTAKGPFDVKITPQGSDTSPVRGVCDDQLQKS
jgi:hypothetical protein